MSWLSLPEFEPAPENSDLPNPFNEEQKRAMKADLERALPSCETQDEIVAATIQISCLWALRSARHYAWCWREFDQNAAKERDETIVSALEAIGKRLADLERRESSSASHEKRLYRLEQGLELEIQRRQGRPH